LNTFSVGTFNEMTLVVKFALLAVCASNRKCNKFFLYKELGTSRQNATSAPMMALLERRLAGKGPQDYLEASWRDDTGWYTVAHRMEEARWTENETKGSPGKRAMQCEMVAQNSRHTLSPGILCVSALTMSLNTTHKT